jgi:hypothetical protein
MAITHAPATRTGLATYIRDQLDAGAGAGVIEIRTAGSTTLLATITLDDPCGTVAAETLTFTGFPKSDNSIDADGTAAVVEWKDSDGNLVYSGTITESGGGGDVQLASSNAAALNFVTGNTFTISSASYTASV